MIAAAARVLVLVDSSTGYYTGATAAASPIKPQPHSPTGVAEVELLVLPAPTSTYVRGYFGPPPARKGMGKKKRSKLRVGHAAGYGRSAKEEASPYKSPKSSARCLPLLHPPPPQPPANTARGKGPTACEWVRIPTRRTERVPESGQGV